MMLKLILDTIKKVAAVVCFTTLAFLLGKWWIALFAYIFFWDIEITIVKQGGDEK